MNSKRKTLELTLMALFVALIAVGAIIRIPIPFLPITLQTFFVMLCGLILGGKLGACATAIYVAMGLIGLPVFTDGGGLGYVMLPKFGFLIGFIVASFVIGFMARKRERQTFWSLFVATVVGSLIIYVIGIAYYVLISKYVLGNTLTAEWVFKFLFISTFPGDMVKCVVASLVAKRVIPIIDKVN